MTYVDGGHSIISGDTKPQRWDVNAALTGATARILIATEAGVLLYDSPVTIVDAAAGIVEWAPTAGQVTTAVPVDYRVRIRVTWADGVATFPDAGSARLHIDPAFTVL